MSVRNWRLDWSYSEWISMLGFFDDGDELPIL